MALLVGVTACGPASPAWRAPDATELAALERCLAAAAPLAFTATGRVHYESPDGTLDGLLEVRVAPPDRVWLEVRTRALFDLVGARAEVALPGDGFLLIYQERGDALERLEFAASLAAEMSPDGGPEGLLALATGRLPAAALGTPPDLARRSRIRGSAADRSYGVDLGAGGELRLWLGGDDLQRLEWWVGREQRLEVRYDRYVPIGGGKLPTRLQLRAPRARLRARLELEDLQLRQGFEPTEFDVGGEWNPAEDRGVSHG